MAKRIDVEGIIGAGKTTYVRALTSEYDIQPVYEPVKDNPFLDKFYEDPKRHAFTMQMWLLARRHAANSAAFWLARSGVDVAVDRGRMGDRCFARVNARIGNMSHEELKVYETFYEAMDARDPDVIVFLDLDEDEAMSRIARRGRACEKGIDKNYLHLLREEHHGMIEEARHRGVDILINANYQDTARFCDLKKLGQKIS